VCCFKCCGSSFDFHNDGVAIEPAQEMPNINASSKLIDNHVSLALVTAPEFRPRILRERFEARFSPRATTFSGSCGAPKDINGPFDGHGDEVISSDGFKCSVVRDIRSGVKFIESIRFSQFSDAVPISLGVSLVSHSSQFELGSGDSGVFFPDVLECGIGLGEFSVVRSKYAADTGESSSAGERANQLPVKKARSFIWKSSSEFKLASDVVAGGGEIGREVFMGNGENPVAA